MRNDIARKVSLEDIIKACAMGDDYFRQLKDNPQVIVDKLKEYRDKLEENRGTDTVTTNKTTEVNDV